MGQMVAIKVSRGRLCYSSKITPDHEAPSSPLCLEARGLKDEGGLLSGAWVESSSTSGP